MIECFVRWLAWIFKLLDDHAGAVTAIATIVIAIFTYWLGRVSGRQAKLLNDQMALAREEFFATHRPTIAILSLEPSHDGTDDESLCPLVMYVNKGVSQAKKIEVRAKITCRGFPLQAGIGLTDRHIIPSKPMLDSGMKGYALVKSEMPEAQSVRQSIAMEGNPEGPKFICLGVIAYEDGIGNRRETGFCRKFNGRTGAWEKVENQEYEYAY